MKPWNAGVLFAVALALALPGQAQQTRLTLSGIVTDGRRPIVGAIVTAGDESASPTATDSLGRFVLSLRGDVKLGARVRLRVQKSHFEPYDELVSVNPSIPLPIVLRVAASRHREGVSPPSTKAPSASIFKFHESVRRDYYTIIMGRTTLRLARAMLVKGWTGLGEIDGERPFRIYTLGGDIYVDAKVYDRHGKLVLRIKRGLISSSLPPGWDFNYSDSAAEVVDAGGSPIFQLVRDHPGTVILDGKWYGKLGSFFGNPGRIKPIFRYPFWKYPHQYAEP